MSFFDLACSKKREAQDNPELIAYVLERL